MGDKKVINAIADKDGKSDDITNLVNLILKICEGEDTAKVIYSLINCLYGYHKSAVEDSIEVYGDNIKKFLIEIHESQPK